MVTVVITMPVLVMARPLVMSRAPVDNYRKQIGQQANRVDKKHHKTQVKQQGARVRRDWAVSNGLRITAAILVALLLLYVLAMFAMSGNANLLLGAVIGMDLMLLVVFVGFNYYTPGQSRKSLPSTNAS